MELSNMEDAAGDKFNLNGDCTPPPKKQSFDLNHTKNIDDISTPSELKFDEDFNFEDPEITEKRKEIERCLHNPDSVNLEQWQYFARSKGGLISDDYRKAIWPILVGVTKEEMTDPPSLDDLSTHGEYNQVVLDVNRSLKRFPPGIPYEQRVALQDQLTVLILRVIIKHPDLKYYQGYHDVAITLLLVCGDRASFPLLCRLSCGPRAPLQPFMQTTMAPTQHLLNYMLPIVRRADPAVADCLDEAQVGTMFALPWYLTWFGHSLNRYSDVVRLYDYFLCAPPLFPVYVTAALVLHRGGEVLRCECDMAMLHCLLSRGYSRTVGNYIFRIRGESFQSSHKSYDYFLCAPPLFPVYVTAALVLHRGGEVLRCECDMAMLHCLLSRLPDDLPFEDILVTAEKLYKENDPEDLEPEVQALEKKEAELRRVEEERMKRRQAAARARAGAVGRGWAGARARAAGRLAALLPALGSRRALLATATVLLGVCVYYRPDLLFNR